MYRYALYYAPVSGSALWQAGCRWLGRDAHDNRSLAQPEFPDIHAADFRALTQRARLYGFHATLSAPFRLRAGRSESQLLASVAAFARTQPALALHDLQVGTLKGFLALRPAGSQDQIRALAQRCVAQFADFRAPSSPAELDKRRSDSLSPRQDQLLLRWGYPYTEEEFRFHMTLSSSIKDLDSASAAAVTQAAVACFAPALSAEAVVIDGLTLFVQPQPEAPFVIQQRFAFAA